MSANYLYALLLPLLALACGDKEGSDGANCGEGTVEVDGECVAATEGDADTDTDSDSDTDADSDSDTDADTDTDTDADAPSILSFSANVTQLTEGEAVTFTAVVTHPQGIEELIGGTLMSDGGVTYGAFATAADEGSYTLRLTWEELHQVQDIELEQGEEAGRTFVAQFYDQAGEVAERSTTLTLHCDGGATCDGLCKDLDNDADNCGVCERSCDDYPYACSGGGCAAVHIEDCVDGSQTCGEACVEMGFLGCYPRVGFYESRSGGACHGDVAEDDHPCEEQISAWTGWSSGPEGGFCFCTTGP